jgi:hypothetical protein
VLECHAAFLTGYADERAALDAGHAMTQTQLGLAMPSSDAGGIGYTAGVSYADQG